MDEICEGIMDGRTPANAAGIRRKQTVRIFNVREWVVLDKPGMDDAFLTPAQARFIARCLYRAARRVENALPSPPGKDAT